METARRSLSGLLSLCAAVRLSAQQLGHGLGEGAAGKHQEDSDDGKGAGNVECGHVGAGLLNGEGRAEPAHAHQNVAVSNRPLFCRQSKPLRATTHKTETASATTQTSEII